MLDGTHRDSQEVIGSIPPKWAPATVEKIAINAVMAGCLPEYLPVVIGAVEAIYEPRFNLYGVQATTGYVGPALLVNGPLRKTLDINCVTLGVWAGLSIQCNHRSGDSVDTHHRRRRFPRETDRSTFGWPGKYTMCLVRTRRKAPGSRIMSRWVLSPKRAP